MMASIKYSFEYYQDSNGEQAIKITGSDLANSDFNNTNGKSYAGGLVNLITKNLQNNNVHVSGIKNTSITIDNNLINTEMDNLGVIYANLDAGYRYPNAYITL